MGVKLGVKMDNTSLTVSIQSYRPASHAGLTPCAKRITPYFNSPFNSNH